MSVNMEQNLMQKLRNIGFELYATHIEAVEAKLAKAVADMQAIEADCDADCPPSHDAIKNAVRAIIADLKGGDV